MIHNEKGFALVITMSLLPFLIAGFLLAWASIGFVQQDLALKHACREEGLSGQRTVGPLLKKLLDLNPEAKRLKTKLEDVKKFLKAARAAKNVPLIATLEATKKAIEIQRGILDFRQHMLIQRSNFELKSAFTKGHSKIQDNALQTSNILVKVSIKNISGTAPKLAIRPDYSDIAPTYSTVPDFTNEQALAHEWQYALTIQKPFSQFLSGEFGFKKACAVSLKEEFKKWNPIITRARYSSKSVW